jgi:hypothetical protein
MKILFKTIMKRFNVIIVEKKLSLIKHKNIWSDVNKILIKQNFETLHLMIIYV